MNLKPNSKVNTSFSLASMTDIIFQLLIFFMLTSSFVTPAALPVNLPSSVEAPVISPKVQVTVTTDHEYYVNEKKVPSKQLESEIRKALQRSREPIVVLNIDKDVSVEYLVKVASVTNKLGAKVSIATRVETD